MGVQHPILTLAPEPTAHPTLARPLKGAVTEAGASTLTQSSRITSYNVCYTKLLRYDNPKFVEDMVRDVAARLNADDRISAYVVESENFESIHNHSAYAQIRKLKDGSGDLPC